MLSWYVAVAIAAETPEQRLVVRGVTERWADPALATVYQGGTWEAAIGWVGPIAGPLRFDLEAGFARLGEESPSFEMIPLSGLVEVELRPDQSVRPFVGAGPALTLFAESGGGSGVIQGGRICGELRAGFRADLQLVQPPMPPAKGGPIRRVELEFYLDRRAQMPRKDPEGLRLGAWRGALGLALVF